MLVIFDCDGVLVDSEDLVNEIEVVLLRRWGWTVSRMEIRERFKGRPFTEVAGIIRTELGDRLPDNWMYEWAMEIARGFHAELRAVSGIEEVLQALVARKVPICVASQSSLSRVQLSLAICKLDSYFEGRLYSAFMVERAKPAPDLFLYAARTLRTAPDVCVVIEDSASGVTAAVAAGMRAFGYAADGDFDALERAGATGFSRMSSLMDLLKTSQA